MIEVVIIMPRILKRGITVNKTAVRKCEHSSTKDIVQLIDLLQTIFVGSEYIFLI